MLCVLTGTESLCVCVCHSGTMSWFHISALESPWIIILDFLSIFLFFLVLLSFSSFSLNFSDPVPLLSFFFFQLFLLFWICTPLTSPLLHLYVIHQFLFPFPSLSFISFASHLKHCKAFHLSFIQFCKLMIKTETQASTGLVRYII